MTIVNLTANEVKLNDNTIYSVSGIVATVDKYYSAFTGNPPFAMVYYGQVNGLVPPAEDTVYIVDELVAKVVRNRSDLCIIPADHPENVYDNGVLVSVPGLIRI